MRKSAEIDNREGHGRVLILLVRVLLVPEAVNVSFAL